MSYILDALRKADAERERGHVPGIHAQPVFAGAPRAAAPRTARPWLWIAVAVLVLLVGVLSWALLGRSGAPAAAPATVTLPATAPVAVAQAVPQPAWVAATPAPQASLAAPSPKPATPVVPRPVATKPAAGPKAEANAGVSAGAGASAPGAAGEARIYALNELPDDIRRQLPALAIGGSMYSAKPADRILIINGQVLHEGDKIAPELVLQQIKLKAAVLAFKGYRYAVTF
jgi:general secretion pathway protein B